MSCRVLASLILRPAPPRTPDMGKTANSVVRAGKTNGAECVFCDGRSLHLCSMSRSIDRNSDSRAQTSGGDCEP